MSEEFIVSSSQPEEQPESPGKRITRRRLNPKINPSEKANRVKHPSGGKAKKGELNEVLANLYNDNDEGGSNLYEISMKKSGFFQKFATFLIFGVFLASVIWAGFFFFSGKNNTNGNNQVNLSINGPTNLSLGATTTYIISYENNSNVALKKATLNAYFPEGFSFQNSSVQANNAGHNEWNLGTISPYQKGSINVTGLNYGSLNEQKSWRVFLNYRPANFNSELQKAATLTTAITNAPIKLTISGPDQVSIGADVIYTFNVQRNADWREAMVIMPEVPSNFNITSSSPALDKNKQWQIPASTSTNIFARTTFSIIGNYTGAGGNPAPMKGTVLMSVAGGQYFQIGLAQLTSSLVKNDVIANLAINGSAVDFDSRPGDSLNISIRIKNQSAKQINNATIKLMLTAPADHKLSLLDWAALIDKNKNTIVGEQIDDNTRRGIISWNSSQVPTLAVMKPNSEVTIDIQLPIKDAKKFNLDAIKTPTISASVEVKFKDAAKTTQSVSAHPINLTLNSDLTFSNDDAVVKDGEGGEKHTISWVLNNTFHPLKDIIISATAFGDVSYSLLNKAAGEFTYDASQNKIIWSIPEMPAESDVLDSSFSVTLNKRNPTQNLLLSKAHLTAVDSVTGRTIDLAAEEIPLEQ
ncbi:MAG: hypothetical protein AAB467_01610 [Patescibacteria group bacterium]